MEKLNKYLIDELNISLEAKKAFIEINKDLILSTANLFADITKSGGFIYYFGNGGSATDAQHLAAEHVNKLRLKRKALPAMALTPDSAIVTSIANDIDFDSIFSRQIEAFGKANDIAIGISTSGNSPNVIKALELAKSKKMHTIAFTGGTGGLIVSRKLADTIFCVSTTSTSSRIQETYMFLGHILIELMDQILFDVQRH